MVIASLSAPFWLETKLKDCSKYVSACFEAEIKPLIIIYVWDSGNGFKSYQVLALLWIYNSGYLRVDTFMLLSQGCYPEVGHEFCSGS